MCCASRFCTGGGGAPGSRSKQCPRALKQNASPGEQSEALRRRWKPGQEQNPGPENRDSQHMLEQPRGYFPDENQGNALRQDFALFIECKNRSEYNISSSWLEWYLREKGDKAGLK